MRFKAKLRLRLLGDKVPRSLLALCLASFFQHFYTDHRYVSWVFLLPGQVWFTTSTGLGIKGAYRPMQAEGRGPEDHCPFLWKHVPKPSPAAPQTALSGIVVFQTSLTHLVTTVCRCLQKQNLQTICAEKAADQKVGKRLKYRNGFASTFCGAGSRSGLLMLLSSALSLLD